MGVKVSTQAHTVSLTLHKGERDERQGRQAGGAVSIKVQITQGMVIIRGAKVSQLPTAAIVDRQGKSRALVGKA